MKLDLGRSPLPCTVERDDFVRETSLPTSLADDSWSPPPPTAAPAEGG
jgi:hypothetical protein